MAQGNNRIVISRLGAGSRQLTTLWFLTSSWALIVSSLFNVFIAVSILLSMLKAFVAQRQITQQRVPWLKPRLSRHR